MSYATRDALIAFDRRLRAMVAPGWDTFRPGQPVTGKAGLAWQRVSELVGEPDSVAFGAGVWSRIEGFAQIDVFYPSTRRNALFTALQHADAVARWFFPADAQGIVLAESNTSLILSRMPTVRHVGEDGGTHVHVAVGVPFRAEVAPTGAV